jgi:hypothetical protein
MLWSMEVSHGVSEYGRSMVGVPEYHMEYGSIVRSIEILLKILSISAYK